MARGINKVILIGNLGQDPETRYSGSGTCITNLNVATDESYKDKQSGQTVPKTEWHRVVLFGKLAEIAGQYLMKGSKIYLEGRLQTREWEKDGIKRYSTEIIVDMGGTMQMLDSKPDGQQQAPQQRQPAPQQRPAQQPAPQQTQTGTTGQGRPVYGPVGGDEFDDDIPFSQFERNTVA